VARKVACGSAGGWGCNSKRRLPQSSAQGQASKGCRHSTAACAKQSDIFSSGPVMWVYEFRPSTLPMLVLGGGQVPETIGGLCGTAAAATGPRRAFRSTSALFTSMKTYAFGCSHPCPCFTGQLVNLRGHFGARRRCKLVSTTGILVTNITNYKQLYNNSWYESLCRVCRRTVLCHPAHRRVVQEPGHPSMPGVGPTP
jgi:hypothetical protein